METTKKTRKNWKLNKQKKTQNEKKWAMIPTVTNVQDQHLVMSGKTCTLQWADQVN